MILILVVVLMTSNSWKSLAEEVMELYIELFQIKITKNMPLSKLTLVILILNK
jgi:hypothetical protein